LALSVSQLRIEISANASGVNNAISGVETRLKGLGSAAGTLGTALVGGIAGGAVVAGIGAVTGAIGGLGDGLIGANSRLEQARAVMTAFTKDAGLANDIIQTLSKEADITPFDTADMIEAGKSLISVAGGSKDALMGLVKEAEILAALNPAEGLQGAAFALKEAVSGDFTSIIERFNLSRSSINKFKAEGKEGIDVVRAAMKEMGADASLVEGLANTFEGRRSSVEAFFNEFKRRVGEGIFEKLSEAMGGLLNTVNESGPGLLDFATNVGKGLGELTGKVIAFATQIPGLLTRALDTIKNIPVGALGGGAGLIAQFAMKALGLGPEGVVTLGDAVKAFTDALPGIIGGIQKAIADVQIGFESGGVAGGAGTTAGIIAKMLGLTPEAVSEISLTVGNIVTQVSGALDSLKAIFFGGDEAQGELQLATILNEAFGPDAASTIVGTVQVIKDTIDGLGATIATFTAGFREGGITEAIHSVFGPEAAAAVGSLMASIQSFGATVGDVFVNQVLPALGQFKDFIGPAMVPVLQGFATLIGASVVVGIQALSVALNAVTFVLGNTGTAFSILGGLADLMKIAIETATTAIGTKFDELGTAANTLQTNVGKAFSDLGTAASTMATTVGQFFSDLGTGANTAKDNVITAFNQLKGGAETALSNMGQAIRDAINGIALWAGGLAANIGKSVVDGLVGSLNAGAKAVGDAASALGTKVQEGLGSIIRPGSPSKMAEEMGEAVAQGLALGMNRNHGDVAAAAEALAAEVYDMGPLTGEELGRAIAKIFTTDFIDEAYKLPALIRNLGIDVIDEVHRLPPMLAEALERGFSQVKGGSFAEALEASLTSDEISWKDVVDQWFGTQFRWEVERMAEAGGLSVTAAIATAMRENSDPIADAVTTWAPVLAAAARSTGEVAAESFQNGWAESMRQFNPQNSFDFLDQRDFEHWQDQKRGFGVLPSYTSSDPKVQQDMRTALGPTYTSSPGTTPVVVNIGLDNFRATQSAIVHMEQGRTTDRTRTRIRAAR
jgi:hypothetical protein